MGGLNFAKVIFPGEGVKGTQRFIYAAACTSSMVVARVTFFWIGDELHAHIAPHLSVRTGQRILADLVSAVTRRRDVNIAAPALRN